MKSFFRILVLTLCICTAPPNAHADGDLLAIRQMVHSAPIICGDFTQHKTLRALARPLVSTGRFIFVAGGGVLWQVKEPFANQVLVNNNTLTRWDGDGVPHRVELDQVPLFRALSEVFFATFTGDFDRLEETFDIEAGIDQSTWRLTLKARNPNFSAIIPYVHLTGGHFLDQIVIAEGHGDQTQIIFLGTTSEKCEFGETEKGYFAQ